MRPADREHYAKLYQQLPKTIENEKAVATKAGRLSFVTKTINFVLDE